VLNVHAVEILHQRKSPQVTREFTALYGSSRVGVSRDFFTAAAEAGIFYAALPQA